MKRAIRAFAFAAFLPSSVWASTATLMGFDVYGSTRIGAEQVKAKWGPAIDNYVRLRNYPPRKKPQAAELAKADLEREIKKTYDLAFAGLSWFDYFVGTRRDAYITLDVVEKADAQTRMPFSTEPTRSFPDDTGLIQAWTEYSDLGWRLVRDGQLRVDRPDCAAFYCLWGSQTPELKAFEERFISGVPPKKERFLTIIRDDKDPVHRANAVYLLSYSGSASELASYLKVVLQDPHPEVRSAALKVYADLAVNQKELSLPVELIGAALDYPTVEDRNKALAVLIALADREAHRPFLLSHAAERCLKLLRLTQPANHDLAYAVLLGLSKENYPARDYAAWEGWIARAKAAPPAKK